MFNNFLPKNRTHDEIMLGNMVDPDSPQLTVLYSAEKMQEYKHRLIICNTHCFSMATGVIQLCLSVMLYVHCLPHNHYYNYLSCSFSKFSSGHSWGIIVKYAPITYTS